MTTLTPTRKLLKKQAVLDLKGVFREEAFAAVNPDIGAALLLALPDDEERQQSLHTLCGPQRAAIFEATPPEVLRIMLAHIGPVDMKHTLHSMRGNHGKELVALMPAKIREAVIEQLNDEEKEALQIQVDAGAIPRPKPLLGSPRGCFSPPRWMVVGLKGIVLSFPSFTTASALRSSRNGIAVSSMV